MGRALAIAVDGPASAGKGTVARGVARELGYAYVDTGAMYRAVALVAVEQGLSTRDGPAVARVAEGVDFRFGWSDGVLRVSVGDRDVTDAIRTPEVGLGASDVAAQPAVRAALLQAQRDLGDGGGVVMDGRDIGTVVLPRADLKIFLTATLQERARRRHRELRERGLDARLDQVQADLEARDAQDSGREIAPLKQAADAVFVDSTGRSVDDLVAEIVTLARRLLDASGEHG